MGQVEIKMTLANKRVQVVRPTVENSFAQGVVGMALPAINGSDQYYLIPDDGDALEKVEGVLFGEAELEPLP